MKLNLLFILLILLSSSTCKKKTAGTVDVVIDNLAFSPATINITAGTTVKWTNQEANTHTVTSDSTFFDSNDLIQSKTFSFTFTTIGTFNYHCKHHAAMKGTVIVK